ncbi:hypothetical protein SGRA_4224 [Saprospira grandis str. Lewin]|uniref:Uncharacterized protein n=1 Tax=Saprospira grandis (strain Lewin) TaxID=984262 RepID=H6L7I8_SAPGL|nr:hypothetical protein SGRA_4224 [Saprospira grandis str. Lewin]
MMFLAVFGPKIQKSPAILAAVQSLSFCLWPICFGCRQFLNLPRD